MQKQISWGTQTNDESFSLMLKQAEAEDKEAIGKVIDFLDQIWHISPPSLSCLEKTVFKK